MMEAKRKKEGAQPTASKKKALRWRAGSKAKRKRQGSPTRPTRTSLVGRKGTARLDEARKGRPDLKEMPRKFGDLGGGRGMKAGPLSEWETAFACALRKSGMQLRKGKLSRVVLL